jgi:hypothetical protein
MWIPVPGLCLPAFSPWTGKKRDPGLARGEGMAGSETKRAAVYNKPGVRLRKMEGTRWLAAFLLLIILIAGVYIYGKSARMIATLGLPVTLAAAVGVFYWVRAAGEKADEFSGRALDAREGAVAEGTVGNPLGVLPAGYFVLHDFVSNRGNIDHILISPKGILTVETKRHKGVVSCEGEMLRHDGQAFEKDFIKQAWAQAFCIRDLLVSHGVSAPKPQPVILFANADVQVRKPVRGVEIVSRRYLPVYLKLLQKRMDTNEAEKIYKVLKLSQTQMFV